MESERKFKFMMHEWFGSMPKSSDLKDIRVAQYNYNSHRQSGFFPSSSLDLEMLLEKTRWSIIGLEDKAEQPGEFQQFLRGYMDASRGLLRDIFILHEAKKKVKRDILNEAKQEVLDRERESNRNQ